MDLINHELIKILAKDAKQSSKVLAKQLKTTASTVRFRIRKLIKNKAIKIVAVVDPDKIGLPLQRYQERC